MRTSAGKASVIAIVVATTVAIGAALGIGVALVVSGGESDSPPESAGTPSPTLPDGAIAAVADAEGEQTVITEADFDRSLSQMAAQMQIGEVPEREDPQWNEVAQNAIATELDIVWMRGEADERGVSASERQVEVQLETIATQEFGCPSGEDPFECDEFSEFTEEIGFTDEEIFDLTEVGVLSDVILDEVRAAAPEAAEDPESEFIEAYNVKWTARTVCADDYLFERCSNADGENVFAVEGADGELDLDSGGRSERPDGESEKPAVEIPDGPPPDELVVEDLEVGGGAVAGPGDTLVVDYVGVLYDGGEEFDTSWGREPFEFELGAGMVIQGWDQGVEDMRVGGRRQLVIPPQLAYGAEGSPPTIPGDAALVFVVELLAVE